ncbi:hypothetical protein [Lactiplantibacillus plantarum]|uniref:hypothetical protein n=1 Tax=Lactiplantibacillus plantarum TaxID=1590 RepID=UPI000976DF32|nr:hypothetical protein [Lactiplantibacillus plantarum]
MSQPNTLHPQAYCYYIELTGSEWPDLITALTTSEQELGDWEPVQAAKLPTWRLWTDANADTIRYTVAHVIARSALPQNAYWLLQYKGTDHGHPRMLHPQFHTR